MNRYRLFGAVAVGSIAADQATKIYARAALPGESVRVPVIDGFWDWVLEYNTGSAFSLFSGGIGSRIFLSVVAIIALAVILHLVKNAKDKHRGMVVALGLMAGGALGNLIDRILIGKVTDFVLWHYGSFYWPVFNVADIALVFAVPLFLFYGYRAEKENKLASAKDDGDAEAGAKTGKPSARSKPSSKNKTRRKKS